MTRGRGLWAADRNWPSGGPLPRAHEHPVSLEKAGKGQRVHRTPPHPGAPRPPARQCRTQTVTAPALAEGLLGRGEAGKRARGGRRAGAASCSSSRAGRASRCRRSTGPRCRASAGRAPGPGAAGRPRPAPPPPLRERPGAVRAESGAIAPAPGQVCTLPWGPLHSGLCRVRPSSWAPWALEQDGGAPPSAPRSPRESWHPEAEGRGRGVCLGGPGGKRRTGQWTSPR